MPLTARRSMAACMSTNALAEPTHIRANPCEAVAASTWLDAAAQGQATHWVANVDAQVKRLSVAGVSVPLLMDGPTARLNSYVCGAQAAWCDYALEEALRALSGPRLRAAHAIGLPLRASAGALMAAAGMHRAAWIDNALFSTQLHDPHLAALAGAVSNEASLFAGERLLLWRNQCAEVDPALFKALQNSGWVMLPARRIYLCDPSDSGLWKRNHVRKDQRLLDDGAVQWLRPSELREADLAELRACFRTLFIDKHSALNPDFTPAFFERCLKKSDPLELHGLRWKGRIVGVLGLYARHGWLTTPLIGYASDVPAQLGVYRRLMAGLLRAARDRGLKLHYSSGAGEFKRNRGGEPFLEYTAANPHFMPAARRAAFELFARPLRQLAPQILERYG